MTEMIMPLQNGFIGDYKKIIESNPFFNIN